MNALNTIDSLKFQIDGLMAEEKKANANGQYDLVHFLWVARKKLEKELAGLA